MKIFWTYFYLIFPFLSVIANSKSLNQQIYEDIKNVRCQEVSQNEIQTLQCQLSSSEIKMKDLDKLSEAIVFSDLAECESSRLACLKNELRHILSSAEIQNKLIGNTCDRLAQLRDSKNNIEFLDNWIKLKQQNTSQ